MTIDDYEASFFARANARVEAITARRAANKLKEAAKRRAAVRGEVLAAIQRRRVAAVLGRGGDHAGDA